MFENNAHVCWMHNSTRQSEEARPRPRPNQRNAEMATRGGKLGLCWKKMEWFVKTPLTSVNTMFEIPTFMWFMVGAGVTGQPFLAFLDSSPHKQCLIIIIYPARDSTTFCCFSRLRYYIRPTASSSWWGNALGFPKPQIYGVSMMTIIIVDSSWRHNDMYCYATMCTQGKVFCLLMLEFKCHLWYCAS